MSDISKCYGIINKEECKLKDFCYRYTSPLNNLRQSYLNPLYNSDNNCEFYYPRDTK